MPKYEAIHEIVRGVKGKLETIEPGKPFDATKEEVSSYPEGSYREFVARAVIAPTEDELAAKKLSDDKIEADRLAVEKEIADKKAADELAAANKPKSDKKDEV